MFREVADVDVAGKGTDMNKVHAKRLQGLRP
jgi:hypothetical protein